MRTKFSLISSTAAAIGTVLLISVPGHAQTTQTAATTSSSPASSSSGSQAQANPITPAHNDGASGKSSRPYNQHGEPTPDFFQDPR